MKSYKYRGNITTFLYLIPNTCSNILGNSADDFSPLLLRLVTGSQNRWQEMKGVLVHITKSREGHGELFFIECEPHGIHDENELTFRESMRPWFLAQPCKRLRMTFRKTVCTHVYPMRLLNKCEFLNEGLLEIHHAMFSRFYSTFPCSY